MRSKFRDAFQVGEAAVVSGETTNTLNTWIKRDVLKLEKPKADGWKRYSLRDVLWACALAEVNRMGIAPTEGKLLVYVIVDHLKAFASGEWKVSEEKKKGRFAFAKVLHADPHADDDKKERER